MIHFSERLALSNAFEKWAQENGVAKSPMGLVAFFEIIGAFNEEAVKRYLTDKKQELPNRKICPSSECLCAEKFGLRKGSDTGMNCPKSVIDWLTNTSLHAECLRDWYSIDELKCLATEALKLLKTQEPTLLSITEILEVYPMCWFENRATHSGCYCQTVPAVMMNGGNAVDILVFGSGSQYVVLPSQYNKLWRCWSSKPAKEQMEVAEWQ